MIILFKIFWLILINLSFYFVNWFLNVTGTSLYIFIKIAQESLDLSAFRILFKLISWSKYSLMDSE